MGPMVVYIFVKVERTLAPRLPSAIAASRADVAGFTSFIGPPFETHATQKTQFPYMSVGARVMNLHIVAASQSSQSSRFNPDSGEAASADT